ncbi:MAG: NapC/NirT family cytochrome c [Deltaproteobacteria bacterium]|nr:NapC/NirT family cytochrome c [Deltaproteobacteria bacterium]
MDEQRPSSLRHPVSLAGAALATVSGVSVLSLFVASIVGFEGGPYLGMVAYVGLPSLLVVGLLLIPLGVVLERRRLVRLAALGQGEKPLPIIDFNRPRTRVLALAFLGLTTVNVLLLLAASYKGLELMDSPQFCGSCHSVMDPETTAHRRSPHARVKCAECHIGPGASWFVKSKLSGSWQLVSVTLDLYPRPIPTPVHNLRPARDTCEQCHWPTKFTGDRLRVTTRHADDEASSPRKTVLLLHVGGAGGVASKGIHWHVDPGVRIRYQADEKREKISTVELTSPGGEKVTYQTREKVAGAVWREMDCVDCHNRPTHVYRMPDEEVDAAIEAGRLDRAALPFLRREAVKLLRADYPSGPAARAGIRERLLALYPAPEKAQAVAGAADELTEIWSRNVWPGMKITWGTYPSMLGHEAAPGCFRCHDGDHAAADGTAIRNACSLCHNLLAQDEAEPAILKQLTQ